MNNGSGSKILSIIIAVITSVTVTTCGFLIWYKNNPYIIVVPADDAENIGSNGRQSFDPSYGIVFDKNKVDFVNVKKYKEVYNLLRKYFYKEVDENVLLEGSIAGMANALEDPYTVYFPKEQMELFMERSRGSYVGIGVTVNMPEDGILTVVEPFEDSPAMKAGMKMGDKIIKVDGEDVTNIRDADMIVSMIKGEENTKVDITVYRPSEERYIDFEIVRQTIKIVNVTSEMLEGNIGYIRISMFDSECAHYFGTHLNQLLDRGMKGLIIDVRDNPGGDLNEVVAIADRLVPEGLIVYMEDRAGNRMEKTSDKTEIDIPLAILINEYSASASEILAGAVKDHKKGTLIGQKTFGKGLVQNVVELDDGSGLKLTTATYFTPAGINIHKKGIEPDIEVELDEENRLLPVSQLPKEDDEQLKEAIKVIKNQIYSY
ncbi:S41 family peptidase [Acetivibrio saccincola]|uniref:Putative CtpA-like serine protease n=1 Tax=Acetivibrio saccincola TaxID=1677857 RepID=A0A2K9EHS1_9FIRM|nr:S41 family peptidase [Acetivibrio saccincola]AUG58765.1 putative CtpA-like serine protease [Acetivibrio saccincola]HOA97320.1 S41 family peptidase [Acetivibrio saccincola]HQD29081.1 S41 family peptidase [Acetivibrio saccincola]